MTGLFDRARQAISLQNPKQIIVEPIEDAIEVNAELNPISMQETPSPSQSGGFVDLGESDDIQFSGEKTPTDAILEMAGDGTDFAVKGVVRSPNAFTAAQVQANYNESLGFGSVAEILRACCDWQYKHNSSDKGERAKLIFGALGTAKQEEFQLEKETKGLLGNK